MGFFSTKSKKSGRATISGLPTPDPRQRLGHDDDGQDVRYTVAELTSIMADRYGDFDPVESVRVIEESQRSREDELFETAFGVPIPESDEIWVQLDPWDGLPARRRSVAVTVSPVSPTPAEEAVWSHHETEGPNVDESDRLTDVDAAAFEEIESTQWHPSEPLLEAQIAEVDDFAPIPPRAVDVTVDAGSTRPMVGESSAIPSSTVIMSVINIKGPSEALLDAFDEYERSNATPEGQIMRCVVPTSDGIAVHDVWESRAALQAWVATAPGAPSPVITPVRSLRIEPSPRVSAG